MTGHHIRKSALVLSLACMTLALSACIPRGGGDYRIDSATGNVRPTLQAPQLVPESRVISSTPSWNPAIVERNSRQVDGGSYLVEQGDTLYRIVSKTGASLADIAAANNLSSPYILQVGQQLTIPTGLYHNVNVGETGIAIARAYGASWGDIVSLNDLQPPYILNIGQRLKLPPSAAASTAVIDPLEGSDESSIYPAEPSPEQRAEAFSLNIDDVVTGSEPAFVAAEAGVATAVQNNFAIPVARPAFFGGVFAWPLYGRTVSRFGSKGGGKVNDGIDIAAAEGTAILASGNGIVVYSGNEIGLFGGLVLVDHGGGWVTAYGHLGQLTVARGDKVLAGQQLGNVGATGYVDQPQLHFEIRRDRKPVDPLTLLPRRT